ncbi:MAG TPA: DNA polymerase I [Eubacterium sp.]|nr:DNA polymerase I [Eubacterium sp.]HBZ53566.1 DNA polymerase I [Eubacterium sp.]
MDKLLLIDGNSILNRAYFAIPDMTNADGEHTNAVYGFINILLKTLEEEKCNHVVVAFDLHEKTFRHEFFSEYKAGRRPAEENFVSQIPMIKSVLSHMGITIVTKPRFEADDILGTLAVRGEAQGMDVVILSGDRDLLQMASDRIKIRMPKTKGGAREVDCYYAEDVLREKGLTPDVFIHQKALMGDSSDNIKGAPGIGEKTALKLLTEYKSIDGIYEHIDELKGKVKDSLTENKQAVYDALFLVTIKRDVDLDVKIEDCAVDSIFTSEFYADCVKYNFKSFMGRFDSTSLEASNSHVELESKVVENAFFTPSEGIYGVELFLDSEGNQEAYICKGEEIIHVAGNCMLEAILDDMAHNPKITMSFYDLKSQLKTCYVKGPSVYDIRLAAYLVNPLDDKMTSADIASSYLNMGLPIGKEANIHLNNAYVACHAYDAVYDKLKSLNMYDLYKDMEFPLLYVLYDMEKEGIGVDKSILEEHCEKLLEGIKDLEKDVYELAGEEFNINSTKALGEILFEKLGLPNGKKTKTGYSTSADVLEKIRGEHPIVPKILDYRTLFKLYSTYASGLIDYVGEDSRIHTTFNQTITATGRISSTEPNLQNIPVRMELGRMIRKAFVAREGYTFVDADYSQIELRILAHMSGDAALIEAYNSAQDIHSITASQVFGVPLSEVTDHMRRSAKAVNFGIIYGISAFGLGEDLGISRSTAKEYIDNYFKTFPGIKAYLDKTVEDARENGFVTTIYGRRRPLPDIKASNFMVRSFNERVAMNSPIQGTAADIMKIAMINVSERLKKEGLDAKIILQIHDEIMIEARDEEVDKVMEVLTYEMEHAAKLKVALLVSANSAKDWFSVK